MSYEKDLLLPRLGEGDGGRLVAWLKQPGESFESGESLLEIETDKAVMEVPAPESGTLVSLVAEPDAMLEIGQPIARIEVESEAPAEEAAAPAKEEAPKKAPTVPEPAPEASPEPRREGERVFATPIARRLAAQHGLDLATIEGTGKRGRIRRDDVLAAAGRGRAAPSAAARPAPGVEERQVETAHGGIFLRTTVPALSAGQPTAVLIHGLFGDLDTWTATERALARANLAVATLDLPCHGRSASDAASFDEVAAAVAEALGRSVSGPLLLVGHSFGGGLAARLARAPGLEVAGLALIAPLGLGTEIEQGFLSGMLRAGTTAALEREMEKLTARPMAPGAGYVEELRRRLAARGETLEALCRSVAWDGVQQVDIRADLAEAGCPVRLLWGRRDAIVPWRHALNAPPRCALHLFPEAGHMPQWEAGSQVAEVLLECAGVRSGR